MNYDELYNKFLEDIGKLSEDDVFVESDAPATWGQLQFLTSMSEGNMMNALPEKEYEMVILQLKHPLTFKEAELLINRILECQPVEVPTARQKDLVKYIKKFV